MADADTGSEPVPDPRGDVIPAGDTPARPASLLTLDRLPTGYRVLYTGVLLFFVLGYAAGLLQQHLRAGLSPSGAAFWILGNETDPDATRFLFALPWFEVLDQVWRRTLADVLPVVVLLALLFRSRVPGRARGALAGVLLSFALVDIAGPALIHFGGARWGGFWFAGQTGLAAAALTAAGLCVIEMHARRRRGRRVRAVGGSVGTSPDPQCPGGGPSGAPAEGGDT